MVQKSRGFENFLREFKRRKTGRVLITYGATAFILLQLADILTPALLLPEWTTRFVTLLLIIGFPFALIFTWLFDVTPQGIKKAAPARSPGNQHSRSRTVTGSKLRLEDIILVILLVLVVILAYPKVLGSGRNKVAIDADGRISIAVSRFENLSGDSAMDSWTLGIQELLICNLGTSEELSVQNSQTMSEVYRTVENTQNASIGPSISKEAAKKLKAGNYITGNFQKTGNRVRIIAKLIETETDRLLWTGKVDGNIDADYISLADSLSSQVRDFLEIKVLEKSVSVDFREAFTSSSDAYRKYIDGIQSFMNEDYTGATDLLLEAWSLDSTFAMAAFYIANTNNIIATASTDPLFSAQAAEWTGKAYALKQRLPSDYQTWIEMWNAYYITENSDDVLRYCGMLEKAGIKSRYYWYDIAVTYLSVFEMNKKAAESFKRIEEICSEWEEDWKFSNYYRYYTTALHNTGDHQKEAAILEKGLKLFPDNRFLMLGAVLCSESRGDTLESGALIERMYSVAEDLGVEERFINFALAEMYEKAGSLNKAEKMYRELLRMKPESSGGLASLGRFLIRYDLDLEKGLELTDKALAIDPENSFILWNKGIGLYKLDRFSESFDFLNKAKSNWNGPAYLVERDIKKATEALNRLN